MCFFVSYHFYEVRIISVMVGILACHVGDRHILIGELDGLALMKVKQTKQANKYEPNSGASFT